MSIRIEDMQNKKELVQNFYNWLFNKEVILQEKEDLSLAINYYDNNIYYPEEIEKIFLSKPMQRLGKITQLSSLDSVYTRLEHSKGVYNRKLELFLMEFQDEEWRNSQTEEDKVYIIGELIKSAMHDVGHLPLSHVIEIAVLNSREYHEKLGKRIVLENIELDKIFQKINPKLKEILREIYEDEKYDKFGFKTLDEGNYDIDRLDYLMRDIINCSGEIPEKELSLLKSEIVQMKYDSGEDKLVRVYEYEDLPKIEAFLKQRVKQYKEMYFSKEAQVSDILVGKFVNRLLEIKPKEGKELQEFLGNIYEIDVNNYEFNDFTFWLNVIDVAQNSQDEELVELAKLILPNINKSMLMAYKCFNIKDKNKKLSNEEKTFLKKLKSIFKDDDELLSVLEQESYALNNVAIFSDYNNQEMQDESYKKYSNLSQNVYRNQQPVRINYYKKSEPIYVKDKDGKIYELSEHPKAKRDWSKESEDVSICFVPITMAKNLTKEERNFIETKRYKRKKKISVTGLEPCQKKKMVHTISEDERIA